MVDARLERGIACHCVRATFALPYDTCVYTSHSLQTLCIRAVGKRVLLFVSVHADPFQLLDEIGIPRI